MTRARFAFIIIYCVLFSLYPAESWAKKQHGQSKKNLEIYFNLTPAERHSSSWASQPNNFVASTAVRRNSPAAQFNAVNSDFPTITPFWSWGAIGLTSGVSCLLLWLLFRKPEHLSKPLAKLNAEEHKPANLPLSDRRIEPLLKIMSTVETPDKDKIIEVVCQILDNHLESANQELLSSLEHEDPQVRLNGINNLKRLYQQAGTAMSKIAAMQSDSDYQVRQAATKALQELNANPSNLPNNYSNLEISRLLSGEETKANLPMVAYLLAELDIDK